LKVKTEGGNVYEYGSTPFQEACTEYPMYGNLVGWKFEDIEYIGFLQPILSNSSVIATMQTEMRSEFDQIATGIDGNYSMMSSSFDKIISTAENNQFDIFDAFSDIEIKVVSQNSGLTNIALT
jgi:hypothetical protein